MHRNAVCLTPCVCVWLFVLALTAGCSSGGGGAPPTAPTISESGLAGTAADYNRYLWSYHLIRVDPSTNEFEVIPLRQVAGHWNVLQFLEQWPCKDCFKLPGISFNPNGTLSVSVRIKHPFSTPNLTGFDVRGIAMFNGSWQFPESGLVMSDRTLGEGELLNADGYTTLYNPTTVGHGFESYTEGNFATATAPNATLNGYRRFVSNDPANIRNAFYAGDEITVTYQVDIPEEPNPWVFGYAVDACWIPPINKPVDDPMADFAISANCPEVWKFDIQDLGPGLDAQGGTTRLQIDVYDWQGKDEAHPVLVECPELFDGEVEGTWVSDEDGFTRYEAEIENVKPAPPGSYLCLVSKEAQENDPSGKPWLDLTAYQVFRVNVGWYPGYPIDVTPPWLNFNPRDVCVDGNYAYVAGDVNGLHIFDISDPANAVWVDKVDTPYPVYHATISGKFAYATYADFTEEKYGLEIFDIDQPESAYIVNTVDTPGFAYGVAVSGEYAYIADGSSGLWIVDVDPPESAYIVNTVDTPGTAYGVAVSGEYAYIADGSSGLQIIDVDPPESAYIVNEIANPGPDDQVIGVAVSGEYAYVAIDQLELHIIDIDPPESAYIYKVVENAYGEEVAVSGDYAYLLNNGSGSAVSELSIIDINPQESAYIVNSVITPDNAGRIAVSEGYAYTVGGSALKVIDIEPPESAYIASSVYTPCRANRVVLSEDLVYVSISNSGLLIIELDTPESPHIFKMVNTNTFAGLLAVSGGCACVTYVGDYPWDSGIDIIDIDPPESAYVASSVGTFRKAQDVEIADGYAYYSTMEHSGIIDIDPPESAHKVAVLTSDIALAIGVFENLAYVSVEDFFDGDSIEIYDINPPESAYVVNTVPTAAGHAIEISGGYAYAGGLAYTGGLKIIDIEPVESAHVVEVVSTPDDVYSIAVSEGYAYVVDGSIHIIDIDPPELAFIVSSFDTLGSARGIAVSGNYAYVACGPYGLRIIKLW